MNMRQLRAKAKMLGVDVKTSHVGIHCEITIEAPIGMVWKCAGVHELISAGYEGKGAFDVLAGNITADVETGVEPCAEPECEWCADARAEKEGDA